MSDLFISAVNLSITASWLILAVIIARSLMKRAPKWIVCALWALVAIRLCLPVSIESRVSLVPSVETVPQNVETMPTPEIDSGIPFVNEAVNPAIAESPLAPSPADSMNPLQLWVPVAAAVWLTGISAMLVYALVSYLKVRKTVAASIPAGGGAKVCDEIRSPFILGIIKPVIYLPSGLPMDTAEQVMAHERAHLARRDHWWKPLGYAILSFYWFNPLCWVAYILLCRDIELACDEKVICGLDRDSLAAYSQALLDCSLNRRVIAACPLAFGEVGVRERVKAALSYKKPAFWIILAAAVLSIVIAVCFMTNPSTKLDGKLGISMDTAVAEHSMDSERGDFFTYAAEVFKIERHRDRTTVYAWVLSEGFSFEDGEVRTQYGSSVPVAVTFDTSDESDGSTFPVIEYWEPRDGSYYADDIRAKFPASIQAEAMNQDSIVGDLKLENFNAAYDYFVGNPEDGNGVFKLTKWTVESAAGFNIFVREGDFELSEEQINALIGRANGIKRLIKSNEYAGLTPGYQICVKLCGINKYSRYEYIYFNGYSAERDMVEVIYNNERYKVEDADFAAYLRSVTSGGEVTGAAELRPGVYKYNDSAVTINADGTAQFVFSMISSFIYHGEYSVDGDRLNVGGYIFKITDEGLQFVADESPEYIWGGTFRDGSVFRLNAAADIRGAKIGFNLNAAAYSADSTDTAGDFAVRVASHTYRTSSDTPMTDPQDVLIELADGTKLLFYKSDEWKVRIDGVLYAAAVKEYEWPPYDLARQWLDNCELATIPVVDYIPASVSEPAEAAATVVRNAYSGRERLSEGSMFKLREAVTVRIRELAKQDNGIWIFNAEIFYTPDGERALSHLNPDYAATYENYVAHGHEALAEAPPDGTLVMTRVGYVKKTDTGWRGKITGTG